MERKKILLIEPFYVGSHKVWADALIERSVHEITLLSLPGKHWKWRMHGAAITLAHQFLQLKTKPDLILVTDMLDLTTFISLIKDHIENISFAVYFHESQFTYPKSSNDTDLSRGRDNHYAFINYTSALAADKVFFNSYYHQKTFLNSTEEMLKRFPDHKNLENVQELGVKSVVLPVGLNFKEIDQVGKSQSKLRILWNHRWEHDKNPIEFLKIMLELVKNRPEIEFVLLGQMSTLSNDIKDLLNSLAPYIIHQGYIDNHDDYIKLLKSCHVLPVTSNQEFFGISVAEAIFYGVTPLLPNRLSYPELIPKNKHNHYLYESTDDLFNLLEGFQLDKQNDNDLLNHITQFEWKSIISKYDQELGAV